MPAPPPDPSSPEQVARDWLALTDAASGPASWEAAATLFRGAVTSEAWTAQLAAVRPALGRVVERTLASAVEATELPGAPDGEYVVLEFHTVFEHKRAAVETVTPMRDSDGRWRVAGYYIR